MTQLYIETIPYTEEAIKNFEHKFDLTPQEERFPIDFPSVYIGESEKENKHTKQIQREAYVGETNWIVQRTKEHLNGGPKDKLNQLNKKGDMSLHIIGHKKFNKSATLLIEQTFMNYLLGDPKFTGIDDLTNDEVSGLNNGRSNDQPDFFDREMYETEVFPQIWKELQRRGIVSSFSTVKNSPLFANSPFKNLSSEQLKAKRILLDKIEAEVSKSQQSTKILKVSGAAGTGKTILLSSLFRDLYDNPFTVNEGNQKRETNVAMLVRHAEQLKIYQQIAKKTNMGNVVFDVPKFISNGKMFDVVLVDEAHLLWTGNFGRVKGDTWLPDLEAIMKLAKVVVLIYDQNQRISSRGYLPDKLQQIVESAESVSLEKQWRIDASEKTKRYIWNLTHFEKNSLTRPVQDSNYEIKFFNSAQTMFEAIRQKDSEFGLSRLVSTYDWKYSQGSKPKNGDDYWMIRTSDGLELPWNLELPEVQKKRKSGVPWQEVPESIDEISSNYTIQGSDLNYVGVILGPSVIWDEENNSFGIDSTKSMDPEATMKPSVAK
ncbi:hypothetical protein BMS91_06855 [Leuconostoc mesenteroides subsp. cremoris]|nr:hypothetical protein BMS91_06855 [Leuconostoc mesenteroides subsp. cremoris]